MLKNSTRYCIVLFKMYIWPINQILNQLKMKKLLLVIVTVTTLLFSCSETKKKVPKKEKTSSTNEYVLNSSKLDSLFKALDKEGKFMGSIALSYNGALIYSNVIGFDDIESQKKATTATKYRIGSISKTFTAALILKAVEENKLKLEQTIGTYFPAVENANTITVENLLTHSSGIHSFTDDMDFRKYHVEYRSPEQMVATISSYKSDFKPNTKANYSNSNYVLLSIILEKIYGTSLKEIIAEKITLPLQLKNTYYGSKISLENKECNSYKLVSEWIKQPETNMSIPMGAGAIVSTPSDLTIFMEALFSEKFLSKESIAKMTTIKNSYGMGISRYSINGRESFGHSGSIDGFKSLTLYFPEDKIGIAITSNGDIDKKSEIVTTAIGYYFNDSVMEVLEADLKKYPGVYRSIDDKSDVFTFIKKENTLILNLGEGMKETLLYKGEHKFLFEQVYAEAFTFIFSPDKKELFVKQGDYEAIYKKE